jgi:DNA-binding MarR family transcriptional regulator
MVVNKRAAPEVPSLALESLDLAYLGFFLGLRVNELVMEALVASGFHNVRESHGYVVQHFISQDRTISELARRMGVTQQAASKVVAELSALGILEAVRSEDRRAKRVRLTSRGRAAVDRTRMTRRRIDARLAKALGPKRYAAAKSTLIAALESVGGAARIGRRAVRGPRP